MWTLRAVGRGVGVAARLTQAYPLTLLWKLIPELSDSDVKITPYEIPCPTEDTWGSVWEGGQDWGAVGSGDCGSTERRLPNPHPHPTPPPMSVISGC